LRIVVKTRNEEYQKTLQTYVPYLRKILVSLSKGYKFKLPEEIILRPLRKYKKAHCRGNNDRQMDSWRVV